MRTFEMVAKRDIAVDGVVVKEGQVIATIKSDHALGHIQSLLRSTHVHYREVGAKADADKKSNGSKVTK